MSYLWNLMYSKGLFQSHENTREPNQRAHVNGDGIRWPSSTKSGGDGAYRNENEIRIRISKFYSTINYFISRLLYSKTHKEPDTTEAEVFQEWADMDD